MQVDPSSALWMLLAPALCCAELQLLGEPHGLLAAQNDGATLDYAAADLDGDGDLDLLLARAGPDVVVLGDGSGRFETLAGALPAGSATTHAAALGDVDGDGDADALLALDGPDALLKNQGDGSFADASALLSGASDTSRDAAFADVDQDGDLDLALANHGPNRLELGDGSGAFALAPGALGAVAQASNALLFLDADQDGDPDLLFGNGQPFFGEPNQLLRNDGPAGFSDTSFLLPSLAAQTQALAAGDVDADGDTDVVAANAGIFGAEQELYLGDGVGGFADGWPGAPLGNSRDAALADVDRDGDLDLYLAREPAAGSFGSVGGSDELYRNDGSGGFTLDAAALPTLVETTLAVLVTDLDGDGDADALAGGRDRFLLGDGQGNLVLDASPLPELPARSLATADVDADGDLDLVFGNGQDSMFFAPGRQTFFLRNDATGFFRDETESVMPPLPLGGELGFTEDLGFSDADGDGDLDLFLGRSGDSNGSGLGLYLYPSAGAAFTAMLAIGGAEVADLELGDVDGDGDEDLFAAQFPFEELLLNHGSGGFVSAPDQLPPPVLDQSAGCALGDVDSDGDLDVLLGNWASYPPLGPPTDSLYLNDGAGAFTDASSQLPPEAAPTLAVELADLDQDGDQDALIARGGAGLDRLYENQGQGLFTDATAAKLGPSGPSASVAVADLDEDGAPDLLLGGRVWLNQLGVFVAAAELAPTPAPGVGSVALGDLDMDGDADALLAGTPPELWRNLRRQALRRGPPRLGKPFALEVRGSPFGTTAIAIAPKSAALALPPFGTLALDPATLLVVAVDALDSSGRDIALFPVPLDPAAVGLSLHGQAFVSPELRFTNREALTLTAW
jgi:hypothetical protein